MDVRAQRWMVRALGWRVPVRVQPPQVELLSQLGTPGTDRAPAARVRRFNPAKGRSIMKREFALSTFVLLTLPACFAVQADFEDDDGFVLDSESVDSVSQPIQNGSPVTTSIGRYVAKVPGCTGTVIGPRHVLTAAHCDGVDAGDTVKFYEPTSAGSGSPKDARTIISIYMPYGVSGSDRTDSNGDFADYQVLYLDDEIPNYARIAMLGWSYLGEDTDIYQVGAGRHDSQANSDALLEWRIEYLRSSDDDGGWFHTRNYTTNNGDSGGPALFHEWDVREYVVHGVLFGAHFSFPELRTRYTSVPAHHAEIARAAGHVERDDRAYPGNTIRTTDNIGYKRCVSQCMHNTACQAYTWKPTQPYPFPFAFSGTCQEKSGTGSGGHTETGTRSGYKRSTGTCYPSGGVCRL